MKQGQGRLKIRVKYCGGCNPGYDRVALVRQIEARLGNTVSLIETGGDRIGLVLAIVGCSIACADLSPFAGLEMRVITCPADAETFIRDLDVTIL
jgi:hypothetical protein